MLFSIDFLQKKVYDYTVLFSAKIPKERASEMNPVLFEQRLTTQALGKNNLCYASLGSTSTFLRTLWEIFPHGTLVVAGEQLSGRGRTGKTFYSPKTGGLYFTVLLKESRYLDDPLFTVKMSYAVCRAIDRLVGNTDVKIKWVNDIYYNQKKIAGILCEHVVGSAEGCILLGIGINLSVDKAVLPTELRGIVGSLRDITKKPVSAEELCAEILNEIEDMYALPPDTADFIALYRARSAVLGKEIRVLRKDAAIRAAALDIAPDGGLIVRYENGIMDKLTAGEISIAIK